jgi:glycosyltransferase involved in cell wall biosynthesis
VDADASPIYRWRRRARLLRGWALGQPMQVADWNIPALHRRAAALAAAWRPEVVQVEYHIMGQYLPALSACPAPRVLTEHDLGAAAARERASAATGLRQAIGRIDARAWERYERAIMRQVQAVVVFTERDRLALAPQAGGTPIECIPLGTDLPARALDPRGGEPARLLFIGNFAHAPNIGAATRLVSAIFPRVRASHPSAMLTIVGDQPPPAVLQAASDQIIVTGRVPDVTPYLDQAAVVVVPLRTGGGMRVKVLEALAAGKAVVASRLAVAGLNVVDREHVLLAETDAEFATAINKLLAEPERRAALAARARAWACAQLSWDTPIASYTALHQRLLASSPASRISATRGAFNDPAPDRGAR